MKILNYIINIVRPKVKLLLNLVHKNEFNVVLIS